MAETIMHYIAFGGPRPQSLKDFTGDWWHGESLDDKSIEIFCDQGMGDLINLLRYVKMMKEHWKCAIILNYYAYHREFARLMRRANYVDGFTQFHQPCDYYTNLMSIPALLNDLKYDCYYPAHFQDLLNTPVPPSPSLGLFASRLREDGFKVGLAWHSNLENEIGKKKSIPVERFAILEDGENQIFSLIPEEDRLNFLVQLPIFDLEDTAGIIAGCDVVVSVDTVSLHLAGAMGKKTIGLLPYQADARWGSGDTTVWYPNVELIRQPADLDWEPVVRQVKERLVSLRAVM